MKILLSIKPEFVNKIISGEKKFEFRKILPKRAEVTTVVVYATKPVGMVVGEFEVKGVLSMPPEQLWASTKDKSGISEKFYSDYFMNRQMAHAFEIKQFSKYKKPRLISDVLSSGVPPQSFCYL